MNNDTVQIQALALGAYLFMHGVALHGHSRANNRSTFFFESGQKTQELIDDFRKHDNPFLQFANALSHIRNIMHEAQSNPQPFNSTHHVKSEQRNSSY